LIFSLIDLLSLSPVSGANDSNDTLSVRKSNGHHAEADPSKAVVAPFRTAVAQILSNYAFGVGERKLRLAQTTPSAWPD
jgi:hypothetical protein